MREIRTYGSEGGGPETNRVSLPLYMKQPRWAEPGAGENAAPGRRSPKVGEERGVRSSPTAEPPQSRFVLITSDRAA